MGNVAEDWMETEVQKNSVYEVITTPLKHFPSSKKVSSFSFFIKNKVFAKIFDRKPFRQYFYKMKGLPKGVAKHY